MNILRNLDNTYITTKPWRVMSQYWTNQRGRGNMEAFEANLS